MSAGDDAALGGLPEHLGEAHNRHGAGRDDVGQHLAGPDRRKLVMSPTIKRAARSGTAFMSDCISMTSTMEVSSITNRSPSSGLSSPRLKPPPLGSTSSSRWIVLASKPVASVMRLAARPVGAHSRISVPLAARIRRMALTMVVLPTPLTGRHFAPMPGGRLQAASDATRTEAVALVEGEGAPGATTT